MHDLYSHSGVSSMRCWFLKIFHQVHSSAVVRHTITRSTKILTIDIVNASISAFAEDDRTNTVIRIPCRYAGKRNLTDHRGNCPASCISFGLNQIVSPDGLSFNNFYLSSIIFIILPTSKFRSLTAWETNWLLSSNRFRLCAEITR